MENTASRSSGPGRIVLGTVLGLIGLVLIGWYAYAWLAGSKEAPVELPPPPVIVIGEPVLLPELAELMQRAIEVIEPEAAPEPEIVPEADLEPVVADVPVVAPAVPVLVPVVPLISGPVRPVERVVIPRIGVDSSVVSIGITTGEWSVPRFIVGHLKESVYPGEVGNSVFAGHLTSLTLGNVFQRLKDLRPGDEVTFYSKEGRRVFRVTESKLVKNTDTSVLGHKAGQTLVTLITCEGRWVPAENDYDQRRIVYAEPVA